ncbi:hypothetical protein JXO52_17160 [bacterium]|nr:hypothetical protein [bacterium]
MAVKAKGNIFYEILIVVLAVGLVAAILYPSKVWQGEAEAENVCRARMDAIYQMELRFQMMGDYVYTDSLAMLKDTVFTDIQATQSLDTLIQWESLVSLNQLKEMTFQKHFPDDLRQLIREKLIAREPLDNLAKWDDLQTGLFTKFQDMLVNAGDEEIEAIKEYILWPYLVGEDTFYDILRAEGVPASISRQTIRDVGSRGEKIYDSRGWEQYYRAPFVEAVKGVLVTALDKNVWLESQKDEWEKMAREAADAALDTLSDAGRDSVWTQFRAEFWDEEREKHWMDDRDRLWEEERESWLAENHEMSDRVIAQKWEAERKKTWKDEAKEALPDSLKPQFPALADSLWRIALDSLREYEYPQWKDNNEKEVETTINNLWQTRRRVTWEEGAYQKWIDEETASSKFWQNVKDRLWKKNKDILWQDEVNKLNQKRYAQKRLLTSVQWANLLGEDQVLSMADALSLPNNKGMWSRIITAREEKDERILYNLGLVPLYRAQLLALLDNCPVSHTRYLVNVVDTTEFDYCNIYCPIIDTAKVMMAYDIDPVAKDTAIIELRLPGAVKIFGGGEIVYHGDIVENRQSWDKKGK